MEQQNQQPIQEKTEGKPPIKTNLKLFAIVAIAAIIFVLGGILLLKATVPSPAPPMETVTISPCDLNADGQCNVADRTLFQNALGKHRGDLGYNPLADADADGLVTAIDQQMLFPMTSPVPQPQTPDASGWQTYHNSEFGFEVRYPKPYRQYPSDNPNVLLLVSQKDAQTWDIRISWYALDTDKKSIYELTLMNSEYTKLGSLDALKLLSDTPPFTEVGYILIRDGKEFGLDAVTIDQKTMNDANQILSTFRFVE